MADVFISYAREDQEFVRKLHAMLEKRHRNTWIDWKNIPLTAKWWEEVCRGIEGSDTFAFVISKDAVESKMCMKELAHAVKNNKRLAPIWHRDVPDEAVPPELSSHQYIFCRDDGDFEEAFGELIAALDRDLKWARAHTELLVDATKWESAGRDPSFLLRGNSLEAAEAMQTREAAGFAAAFASVISSGLLYKIPLATLRHVLRSAQKEPELTPLQKEYIRASRNATTRFRRVVFGTAAFVLIVISLATYAFWQQYEANLQRDRANLQRLAGQAQLMSDQGGGSLQTSVLLAAEARDRLHSSLVADEILRNGTTLLARPGPPLVHQKQLYAVEYSPDGSFVATAGDDGAHLWDAERGEEVARLEHDSGVSSVIFSPDGEYAATSSADGTARVWDVPGGKRVASFEHDSVAPGSGQPSMVFSPDSALLATTDGAKSTAYVWNIAEDKQIARLELSGPGIRAAFGPGGKYLATASLPAGDSANVAQVWDWEKGREVSRVRHDDIISRVSFGPDGKYLATASADGSAGVWDSRSGDEVSHVEHDGGVTDLAFGPDGKRLATASGDATVRVWDVQSGEEIVGFEHDSTVNDLDFSLDGKYLATASLDTAHVWDVATGEEVARMSHLDKLARVSFSPDGEHVATASYDRTARVWDVVDSRAMSVAHDEGSVNSVNVSPDGRYLATVGSDHTARVWDAKSGQEIQSFEHDDVVDGVTFSPDNKYLATASYDNTARLWNIATGEQEALMKHDAGVYGGIAFSPEGERLATASADGTAHVWDVESGKEEHMFKHTIYGAVYSAAFSPDGTRLATAGADGTALVWDIATGDAVAQISPRMTHDREIWDVAFSPDGKYLALAGMDGTVWLWDTASEKIVGATMRHQGPAESLNFSPNGEHLATASYDHTARVWEVPSGNELVRMNHDDSLSGVAFSPDGDRLATAGADGIAHLEPWKSEGLIKEACSRLTHNLTEGEWRQFVGGTYEKTCPDLPVSRGSTAVLANPDTTPGKWENGAPTYSRLSEGDERAGLESIRTSGTAVAAPDACGDKTAYEPKNAVDGTPLTAWKVGGTGEGEWVELKYDEPIEVSRVGIIPGYAKIDPCDGTDRFYQGYVIKRARIEFSDGSSVEKSYEQEPQMQFVDVPDTETSSVRITILDTYPPASNAPYAAPYSSTWETAAVSEIEVKGP